MKKLLLAIWVISVLSTGVFAYNNISLDSNKVNIMWNYILKSAMCKGVKQTLETPLWKSIILKVDKLWTKKIKSINQRLTTRPNKVRKVLNIVIKKRLYIVAPLVDYLLSTQSKLGVSYKQFLLARKTLYCQVSNNYYNSSQNTSTTNINSSNTSNVNPGNSSKQISTQAKQTNDMCTLKFDDLKKKESFTYENRKCLKVKKTQEKFKILNTIKKRYN